MPPHPTPSLPATPSPATLLRERVRSVFAPLPKALTGEPKAIHQMRVAARRLRVALPLLARKPKGRRVKRAVAALRELARVAGGSRDLDVGAEILARQLHDLGASGPGATVLRRHLRQARARSRTRMVEGLLDLEMARLRRDLRAILHRGAEDIFTVSRRLALVRDAKGLALLEALAALPDRFVPASLHQLRIRAKRLRYTAELGQALRGQPNHAAALWKGMQERLGEIHDRSVLAAWLEGQAARADLRRQPALADTARWAQAAVLRSCRTRHRAFREANPESLVREALRAMGQKEPDPAPTVLRVHEAGRGTEMTSRRVPKA